jgi:hypothetical protein
MKTMSSRQAARTISLLLFAISLILCPAPGRAQVLYGSLVGNVTDESQGAVAGAEVTIVNLETNLTRRTLSNEVGLYTFPNVPSGVYSVKVTMSGFTEFARNNVPVAVNTTVRVDAVLRVSGIAEQVTVTGTPDAAMLQTDRAEVRHEVSRRQIENLPVPVGRSYESLLQLIPGFEGGSAREERLGGNRPERSQNFNVSGTTNSTVARNLDGASNMHVWSVGGSAFIPNLESIETVDVVTNSFDAEQGQAGGAVINVQIKSGGNQFHGSAFEYHYNQHLKARDYFRPAGEEKGKYISNQFGGTLGGPIKRDKVFFFTSWEGRPERENLGRLLSLPSRAVRGGDFSGFTAVIYDPMTGTANGAGRTPLASNRVPDARMDPIARKVIDLVPLGNLPGLADSTSNNFFASKPFKANSYRSDNKVNWQARDNFNMFGSLSYFHFDVNNPTAYGDSIDGPRVSGGNAGHSWGYNRRTSAGANYIFDPSFLMDAFFGWTRQNTNVEQPGIETNYGSDVLGIPGTNGPNRFQGGWPMFSVSGYAVFGTEEAYSPYYRNDDQFSTRSNFTKTLRSHEIRWGVDINAEQMNHTQPEFQGGANTGPRGRFNFDSGPTQLCTVVAASGNCQTLSPAVNQANAFAAFLLGLPSQLGKNLLTEAPYDTRTWRYSLYARDRWQATPRLTISYGVRWEYFPMPTRADRGFERYNPDDNKMYIGGVGDIPKDLGVHSSSTLFAPRLGIAFRATDTLVLRAGYGINFDPYSLAKALRTNHPMLIELVVPSRNSLSFAGRLSDGIPPITPPGLGNGIVDVPGNVSTQTIPLDLQRGYIQSWNFTVQKRLHWGFVGEAGYVATRQVRQLGYKELNWAPIGGGTAGQQLNRRFGRTANTREVGPIGGSHYDSLQIQVQRRFTGGVLLQAAYTLSKSISNSGVDSSAAAPPINIPQYYHLNRSVSGFDRRHNLQVANVTPLPFGRGQRWLNGGGIASKLAGGWQANNIVSVMSGRPFSVSASGSSLNAPFNAQRADLVKPEVEILGGVGRGQPYFDPTAFAAVSEARFGTAGFNILRAPGRVNWDLGLFRNFRITEALKMELRLESFNFTNTPKFGTPGSNVSNLQFNPDGSIRSLNGFAEITSASEERQFSLGLRLSF